MKHGNEGQFEFLSLHISILCTLTDPTLLLLAEIMHCWGREASCSPKRDAAQVRVWLLHHCLALFARVPSPKATKSQGPFRASHLKKMKMNTWIFMKTFKFVFIWKKEIFFFYYLWITALCFAKKESIMLEVSLLLEQSQVAWINNLRSGPFVLWPSWEM